MKKALKRVWEAGVVAKNIMSNLQSVRDFNPYAYITIDSDIVRMSQKYRVHLQID